MRRPPLAGPGTGVHRGAQQRVPEGDPPGADRDQVGVLGLCQRVARQSEGGAGTRRHGEVVAAHRGDQQRPAAVVTELVEPVREGRGDRVRHARRQVCGVGGERVEVGPGELDQRQRVAVGEPEQRIKAARGRHPTGRPGHQGRRRPLVEPAEPQHRQPVDQAVRLRAPCGGQHRHRVGRQPSGGEQDRLRRRPVECL
jgi:hypothetical protein